MPCFRQKPNTLSLSGKRVGSELTIRRLDIAVRRPGGAPVGLDDCLALAQTSPLACADGQAKEKPASGGSEAEAHVGAEEGPQRTQRTQGRMVPGQHRDFLARPYLP